MRMKSCVKPFSRRLDAGLGMDMVICLLAYAGPARAVKRL